MLMVALRFGRKGYGCCGRHLHILVLENLKKVSIVLNPPLVLVAFAQQYLSPPPPWLLCGQQFCIQIGRSSPLAAAPPPPPRAAAPLMEEVDN
jgi:hypothetical protein